MTRRGLLGFAGVFAALAVLSLYRVTLGFPIFYLSVLTTILFWVAQATSWNLLSGFSGYFSFGQGAYVGVGAYTTGVLYGRHGVNFFLTVAIAALLCALLGLAVGGLAFRLRALRGEIFALLTLAVPFILAALARINTAIDGGQGIVVSVPAFPEQLGQVQDVLYLADLVVAVAAVALAFAVYHSRLGRALAAIRDAEDVAEGFGVATFRYKMQAIVASAAIGGMSGAIFALQIGFVTVDSVFSLTIPLFVIVMSVLGGRTHWLGPVIGALLVVVLQDRLVHAQLDAWRLIVLGAILIVLVVVAPDGLYTRLARRPWAALTTFVAIAGALATARVWGGTLDWALAGMLGAAAVASWPASRPRRGQRRETAMPPQATAKDDQPAVADAIGPLPGGAAPAVVPSGQVATGEPSGGALVDCQDLARYFGGVRAVDGLTLQIQEGELVGLVGPNGSGKTTLISMLSGAIRPTRGTIRVAGRDITGLPPHRIAHVGVARTYQIPRPFASMTVRDNVALAIMFGRAGRPLPEARRAAEEHLRVVRLDHRADALPAQLNLHHRQMLEIARAIATRPQVLLLDEALAGLNPVEIDNAVQVIRRIHASGISIVIVEHVLRVVNQLATRVVVLDRGRCLADGDPRVVMSDPAVVEAYLGKRAHA